MAGARAGRGNVDGPSSAGLPPSAGEPGLPAEGQPEIDPVGDPLVVEGEGAPIRIFATDLEDILVNVLRNSLDASLRYCTPPVALAVELRTEVDEITGHAALAIRIKDRSPQRLSNEMLRGRYVERGMGITVDLLSRYDGSIAVEEEPGWAKAVVLRFFILERAEDAAGGDRPERRLAS